MFSKTSAQSARISPRRPRAIYFDDAVTLGFIHAADYLEVAAQDPVQGTIFYTLDQKPAETPAIERRDFCLSCHIARSTLEVPGMLVRSVATLANGLTAPQIANATPDHRSPYSERWAGWYVTGTHGAIEHLGNRLLVDRNHADDLVNPAVTNVASAADRFEAEYYPHGNSDIVAHLVFEHQMRMMNLLTRIGWDARVAAAKGLPLHPMLDDAARELVDYMLFVDEQPLGGRVTGTTTYAANFAAQGPRDRRGGSLRDLQLSTRLLNYPCSYLIYSDAFAALPADARAAIYRRLWAVLSGTERGDSYRRLSPADRRAIVEILGDTKPDLPSYFTTPPR